MGSAQEQHGRLYVLALRDADNIQHRCGDLSTGSFTEQISGAIFLDRELSQSNIFGEFIKE